VGELRFQRGGLIEAAHVQYRRAIAAQAHLRERSKPGRKLPGGGKSLPGRHETVSQPDRRRLGGADGAPGEDHVHRPAGPDQPGQAHGAAVNQRDAPAPA